VSPHHTILVVVPDDDLRRSIIFALESEGFALSVASQLPALSDYPQLSAVDCIVVDENAIDVRGGGWERLGSLGRPAILLIDALRDIPPEFAQTAVMKPLLGSCLVDAVTNSVAAAALRQAT
jgi:CheY-like chemotaxis protein